MPIATARPCESPEKPVSFSSAWPKVWPKFRIMRRPLSAVSSSTSTFLQAMQWPIAASMRSMISPFSSFSNRAASMMQPYLMTSPMPSVK